MSLIDRGCLIIPSHPQCIGCPMHPNHCDAAEARDGVRTKLVGINIKLVINKMSLADGGIQAPLALLEGEEPRGHTRLVCTHIGVLPV